MVVQVSSSPDAAASSSTVSDCCVRCRSLEMVMLVEEVALVQGQTSQGLDGAGDSCRGCLLFLGYVHVPSDSSGKVAASTSDDTNLSRAQRNKHSGHKRRPKRVDDDR